MSRDRGSLLSRVGGPLLLLFPVACSHRAVASHPVTWDEISRPSAFPGRRISYGPSPQNFGELLLPSGRGPHPVAVLLHGGCWRARYDLGYMARAARALARQGIATWTLEYRRVGDAGGGWPGTFEDAARGTDHLRVLARTEPLDLSRVVFVGHSAGGHLALWLAARPGLPPGTLLASPDPLRPKGVVGLAAIANLALYATGPIPCNASVAALMGAGPAEAPDRYGQANPIELAPLGVPSVLLRGSMDDVVPAEQAESFVAAARARGDDARSRTFDGAGHFDLVAPFSPAWPEVAREISAMLARR
jgi:acetyl esterase/lipase